jgi:hypothetical protein
MIVLLSVLRRISGRSLLIRPPVYWSRNYSACWLKPWPASRPLCLQAADVGAVHATMCPQFLAEAALPLLDPLRPSLQC